MGCIPDWGGCCGHGARYGSRSCCLPSMVGGKWGYFHFLPPQLPQPAPLHLPLHKTTLRTDYHILRHQKLQIPLLRISNNICPLSRPGALKLPEQRPHPVPPSLRQEHCPQKFYPAYQLVLEKQANIDPEVPALFYTWECDRHREAKASGCHRSE